MKLYVFIIVLFSFGFLNAQEQSEESFFEISFDDFSPPTKELIMSFEGKEPMAFMANDIKGDEYYLKNYKGKVVFIYFWNGDCADCLRQVASLNLLQKEENDRLQIISFADENRVDATALALANGIEFPVLTNGKLIGEAAYGIELGYPRLFALDEKGRVIQVLPQEQMQGHNEVYLQLKDLLNKITLK